jgi:hypothetical protein
LHQVRRKYYLSRVIHFKNHRSTHREGVKQIV